MVSNYLIYKKLDFTNLYTPLTLSGSIIIINFIFFIYYLFNLIIYFFFFKILRKIHEFLSLFKLNKFKDLKVLWLDFKYFVKYINFKIYFFSLNK